MGVVFEVSRDGGERLALKLMNIMDDEGKLRFDREFRALQRLEHDNVVEVFEKGEFESRPFFTMQLVKGMPLDVWVGSAGGGADVPTEEVRDDAGDWSLIHDEPDDVGIWNEEVEAEEVEALSDEEQALLNLPERMRRVQEVLLQILKALAHIHDERIIHRDLKPANVLVSKEGQAMLMDFGIAVDSDEDHASLDTGQLVGTFAYMSPEQLRLTSVDLRADLYALGVMLFELLTGRRPFDADSPAAAIYQHVFQPPPSVSVINPGAPSELASLTMRLLRKRRNERPASAWDVLHRFGVPADPSRVVQLFKPTMTGRSEELHDLVGELQRVGERRFRPASLLIGPAGIGKTRLLDELCEAARGQGFRILRFNASETLESPYSYFNPILELLVDIARDQPLLGRRLLREDAAVIARIAPRLTEVDSLEITAAEALSPDDERRRAKEALWRVAHRLGRQEPLLLVCDQLERADGLSLEALDYISDRMAQASEGKGEALRAGSLALVGAWREGERSDVLVRQQTVRRVVLNPLLDDDLIDLATSCLGSTLSSELIEVLAQCSEGLPLVIIESLRTLAEQKALRRRGMGPWEISEGVNAAEIVEQTGLGGGLNQLVERLLESIPREAALVLGTAAIHRDEFRLSDLHELFLAMELELEQDALLDAQDHLIRHGMFVEETRHRGVYRVAYHALGEQARHRLSDQAYRAAHRHLAVAGSNKPQIDVDEVLFHSTKGHHDELTLEYLPDQALRFSELGDSGAAVNAYELWAAVFDRRGEARPVELISGYSGVMRDLGRNDEAEVMLVETLQRKDLTLEQDSELQMRYMGLLSDRGAGEDALERAQALGVRVCRLGPWLAAKVQQARANVFQRFGDAQEALVTARDTVRRMNEMEVERGMARALQLVGLTEERVGDLAAAQDYFGQAIEVARRLGDDNNLMIALINVSSTRIRAGDLDAAEESAIEAEATAQRLRNPRAGAIARANLEWIALERGATPALEERLQRLLQLLDESGNHFAEPEVRLHRSRCLIALGRREEALKDAEIGVELAKRSHLWREQSLCEAVVALLLGEQQAFEPLIAHMEGAQAWDEALFMRELLGETLAEAGEKSAARKVWMEALETAVDRGYGTAAKRLRAHLGEGGS
jgi:serine/threonine protein kinase